MPLYGDDTDSDIEDESEHDVEEFEPMKEHHQHVSCAVYMKQHNRRFFG